MRELALIGPERSSIGSLAKFAAMRRASFLVSSLGRRALTGLVLEIGIAEHLPGGVLHDEARIVMLLDRPGRREAVRGWHST